MTVLLLSACAGICLLTLPGALPLMRWPMPAVLLIGSLCCWIAAGADLTLKQRLRSLAPLVFLTGAFYAVLVTDAALEQRLPHCSDADFRSFTLEVTSMPETLGASSLQSGPGDVRFQARVRDISIEPACAGLGEHSVRLTWYSAPPLTRGETWRVLGKLRPPWGYRNPGGFDYERWLVGQGLHGTGYVKSGELLAAAAGGEVGEGASIADGATWLAELWRVRLSDWVTTQAKTQPALMQALLLGDDSRIEDEQWQRLRDSGLIHLVVVSGLHVGIVAGAGFAIGLGLSRLLPPLLRRYGSRRLATPVALALSGAYVLLTGAALPSQRAWLLSAVLLLGVAGSRRISLSGAFAWALFLVLLGNPLAVHQQGFWLSFTAVAVLLVWFAPGRRADADRRGMGIHALVQTQLVLAAGLSPAIALLQGSVPLAAPLVNLLAVPLVTLLILPLLLVAGVVHLVFPVAANALIWVVDGLLWLVDRIAVWGAGIPPLAVSPPRGLSLLSPILGTLVLLCAAPVRWLPVLVWGWLVWLTHPQPSPVSDTFRLTAFDVGQGSAILVETRNHRLLFDTGPGFPGGFDLGAAAVVPSLAAMSIDRLDVLVVSHADTDHSGGLESVLKQVPVVELWTSYERAGAARCVAGYGWHWDGVDFRFLHPDLRPVRDDNDGSCVLEIAERSPAGHRALLTGDISRRVEARLLSGDIGQVDLMMAPHHGSRSSSSPRWVDRLAPRILFVSTARRSRYGHPHPEVVTRYESAGASVYVTGHDGALIWSSAEPERVSSLRVEDAAYWRSPRP